MKIQGGKKKVKVDYIKFSEEMRMQRAKQRLSQQDIASKMGVTYQTYARYENDIRNASINDFLFLLNMFELNIDDFIMK